VVLRHGYKKRMDTAWLAGSAAASWAIKNRSKGAILLAIVACE
jgi:hypothetical protein